MAAILPRVDVLLEILDARIPYSTSNPMLDELCRDKPVIAILARDDLADPEVTGQWLQHLRQHRPFVMPLNLKAPGSTHRIPHICRTVLQNKAASGLAINALVAGIPNVGKSSLINSLAGRAIAKTGNEPAVTKQQQQVAVGDDLLLFDTPGVLWPNVENRHSGYRLALTGGIRETAYDYVDVACYAVEYMLRAYPDNLLKRFELSHLPAEPIEFLDEIGRQRGSLIRGGVVDLNRISRVFLSELRSGTLGRLSFETPDMMAEEITAVAAERARRDAKISERKERRKKGRQI